MAKGARRGGRVRDKWKDKQWIVVNSPSAFGGNPVNYLPITDVKNAEGRIIENTLWDFYKGEPTQHQTKVYLQIVKIMGNNAKTIFRGHEYAKDFLRSLVRRGSTMVNLVKDYKTREGYVFRIAVVAFSQRRLNTSKKHEIRLLIDKYLSEKIPQLTVDKFVQESTSGGLSKELLTESKKIGFIRHLGIKKTKLIHSPNITEDQLIQETESAIGEQSDNEDAEDGGDDKESQNDESIQSEIDQPESTETSTSVSEETSSEEIEKTEN